MLHLLPYKPQQQQSDESVLQLNNNANVFVPFKITTTTKKPILPLQQQQHSL
jgi:hypothetical protein